MREVQSFARVRFIAVMSITILWNTQAVQPQTLRIEGLPTDVRTTTSNQSDKIAFVSDRDGDQEIYVMNSNGSGQHRLTFFVGADDFPAWSPDGRTLAFVRTENGSPSIYLMNADGTNIRKIPRPGLTPYGPISWAPNGQRIAFSLAPYGADIFAVDTDGANLTNLTRGRMNYARQPSWSPDGSKIAFTAPGPVYAAAEIWIMNSDGNDLRRITTSQPLTNIGPPRWSPNGERIVFADADQDMGDNNVLVHIQSDGFGRVVPFYDQGSLIFSPSFSPDGGFILFDMCQWSFPPDGRQIFVINRNGGGLVKLTNIGRNNFNPSWQRAPKFGSFDFDGDGKADISVFRPSEANWYLNRSSSGFYVAQFGLSTDVITPADYDGDGKTDISVFRDGTWYWLSSSNGQFNARQFGQLSDVPVPADYTGDGRADLGVYRNGVWWVQDLANGTSSVASFGLPTDRPVAADYDGDGRTDIAVFRDGEWHLKLSGSVYSVIQFGVAGDLPMIGDFDGDGRIDLAVYREGVWHVQRSTAGYTAFPFGLPDDLPVPADYDGDGKTDAAIYRGGTWWVQQSSTQTAVVAQFGIETDTPVPHRSGAN